MFDGTVGASGILMKNGGLRQSTPVQAMAALLPVIGAETTTCSVMAYGFDPYLSIEDPFYGAKAAVVTSVAKLVATGCDPDEVYLSFQEYFERLRTDPIRWGKPFSALLGAFEAQMELGIAAIGGKDSMSGSFNDMDVPPTLVSFAIAPNNAAYVISPEFKQAGHDVVIFNARDSLSETKIVWKNIRKSIENNTIISAWAVTEGGLAEGIFKMALGNDIGFEYVSDLDTGDMFTGFPGAIVAEITNKVQGATLLGRTIREPVIKFGADTLALADLEAVWESVLEDIFPTGVKQAAKSCSPVRLACDDSRHTEGETQYDTMDGAACDTAVCDNVEKISYYTRSPIVAKESFAKPRALVLTFPGSNSEIDTGRAISRAGGAPHISVIRNLTHEMLKESIAETVQEIRKSQILILPGGFSFGDEPDGSAKFIAAFFRNPRLTEVIHEHLRIRDGLMLGICNGFQALIKLGLVPYGQIVPAVENSFTLTHNVIGRHQAKYVHTRVASVNSPWMSLSNVGDIHTIAISHGEGRFVSTDDTISRLLEDGRVATQYTNSDGLPSMNTAINPNGSLLAVEGLFSPCGRVFGKMGHTERRGEYVAKNIYGNKFQPVFESGIYYYS